MKIKFLSAIALCVLLASCGGNKAGNTSENKDAATTEQQAPAAEQKVEQKTEKIDWAYNFMKALDKKYLPSAITQTDIDDAFNCDYRQDEETGEFFPQFSIMHSNDGCYDNANVYTFAKKDGKSCLALFVTEHGCDGSSSTGVKAFTFDGSTIAEVVCPITRPSIDELTKGINDPELANLKKDYNGCKDLAGLDIRLEKGNIEIRPGQLGYDDLYEQYTPAVYTFNGETLVKK